MISNIWIKIHAFFWAILLIWKYGPSKAVKEANRMLYEIKMKHFKLTGKWPKI